MGKTNEGEWEIQYSSYRISHRDERYIIGNTVNGMIIVLCGEHSITWTCQITVAHLK